MPKETKLQDVRQLILSLLVARPGYTPLPTLDGDYHEAEGTRIPYRSFGFGSLIEFLQNMPEYFEIRRHNGITCVRGIASDKCKHVSSLVSRQKKVQRHQHTAGRYQSSYTPYVQYPRPKIPAEQLNSIVQDVQNSPEGVNIYFALQAIQQKMPYTQLSVYDIKTQLRELGHKLYMDGDMIRPVKRRSFTPHMETVRITQSPLIASEAPYNEPEPSISSATIHSEKRSASTPKTTISNSYQSPSVSEPLYQASEPPYRASEPPRQASEPSNPVYTVPEECNLIDFDDDDDDDFIRPDGSFLHARQMKTDEALKENLKEHLNYKQTLNHYQEEEQSSNDNNTDYFAELETAESNNLSSLISERSRLRLVQLIQKYPDGIPCSQLADLYMKEYKVPLNYAELGFNSVSTYVSYLPDIFYMTRTNINGDFILHSIDKKAQYENEPKNSGQENAQETNPTNVPNSRNNESYDSDDDNGPFPASLSPHVLDKFAPKDVVTYDNIGKISVTDLQNSKKQLLEVYVKEVFTPSFFWIHLRKNKKRFDRLMDDIHEFYTQYHEKYTIPKLALKRGLNCACVYDKMWHRGIIKNVTSDFRVTIMFYDYGTQKTYVPEDLYYLRKEFLLLPAQAIPCGLYNIKPCVGDRWRKSVIDRFIDRISEILLTLTIVSVDSPNNSMLVTLTDKNEEDHVLINAWLVQENLARHGQMGDAVDMASLKKYVQNNQNVLPLYCYAEESVIIDSCNKSTITEDETPLTTPSPTPNYTCRDSNQQKRSKPPGFEDFDPYNRPSSRQHTSVHSNIRSTSPMFSDVTEDVAGNSFMDGNSSTNAMPDKSKRTKTIEEQILEQFMRDSMVLQTKLMELFKKLLASPPTTKDLQNDYIKLIFQCNVNLKTFVNEMDDRITNVAPNLPRNDASDAGPLPKETHPQPNHANDASLSPKPTRFYPNDEYDVGPSAKPTSHVHFNHENKVGPSTEPRFHLDYNSFMNQQATSSTKPSPSSTPTSSTLMVNPSDVYYNQYYSGFYAPNTKDFPRAPQGPNLEQTSSQVGAGSHQANTNYPYVRSPSVASYGSEYRLFNDQRNVARDVPSYMEQLAKNMPPTMTTAPHTNTSNINQPSYHPNASEFTNVLSQYTAYANAYVNENLVAKVKETNPFKLSENVETQYNVTNATSFMSDIDLHSRAAMVNENANYNVYKTHTNTPGNESNVGLKAAGPKIVYESGPVMYNLQKESEKERLVSQEASESQDNKNVGYTAPHSGVTDAPVLNDEGYVTPTIHQHNSPVTTNRGNDHQANVSSKVPSQQVLPEAWFSAMLENQEFLQNFGKSSVSTSQERSFFPYKEWNCETGQKSVTGNHETPGSSNASIFGDSEGSMISSCINSCNLFFSQDQKKAMPGDYNVLNNSFLFQQIDSVKGITLLFHLNDVGWILLHEFVKTFTKFSRCSRLIALLETLNITVPLKEIHRSDYPTQFLQLDSYPLSVARDSENRIISVNLISLQAALVLLCKLKIIPFEEMDNIFKRNEIITNNSVLFDMREVMVTYKNFRQHIKQCYAAHRIPVSQ